jgi:hypothetical protein
MGCGVPWSDTIEQAIKTIGELAKRQLQAA